ncbi:MAG: CAP domain-containing protein [Acidimicrobiia bacterium]|nr:CAP domain-containing protein [Acidimicrobiia bacterium]
MTATTTAPIQTTTTAAQRVAGYDPSAESQFVSLINDLRASVGVPALAVVGELRSYARNWSQHMSESGTFEHSNVYDIPGPWQSVAENIATSTSVQNAFNGLVSSSGHYANMVDPDFTEIGSGVWIDTDGKLWVTHVFRG